MELQGAQYDLVGDQVPGGVDFAKKMQKVFSQFRCDEFVDEFHDGCNEKSKNYSSDAALQVYESCMNIKLKLKLKLELAKFIDNIKVPEGVETIGSSARSKNRIKKIVDFEKLSDDEKIKEGRDVYSQRACVGCHTTDGSNNVGPTFKGYWGSKRVLTDGPAVMAEEEYFRESLDEPDKKIVKGYMKGTMPKYKGMIKEREYKALVSFLKTLK